MSEHPSFLELDLLSVGGQGDRAHVDSCARCQAHLARLRSVEELPASLRVRVNEARPRSGWQRLFALPAGRWVLALPVLFALIALPRLLKSPEEPTTRAKAMPSVAVYIRRGEQVLVWNGSDPIQPGDRLRLRIYAEGYRHVTVLAGADVLYQGAVSGSEPVLLPDSWRVDERGDSEKLRVVLSPRAAPDADDSTWSTDLVLPKQFTP